MKTLIAEDDHVSSMVMKQMMSKFGTVEHVDNGQNAMDSFRTAHESNAPFDLVLMDIMMPDVDGLHAVLNIRKTEVELGIPLTKRVKIVMTTALDDPRTVMKALYEADANSYLVKPVTLQKLSDELRSLKLIA
jgi:two-component system chemotaxis response regulator CheY